MIFNLSKLFLAGCVFTAISLIGNAQTTVPKTYANPLNIDYAYMIYNSHDNISYRSGADPAVVEFRGEYYMFVTRSMGYWHSTDLANWTFIKAEKWYFEGSNAPTAHNYKDSVLYVAGNPSGNMSILYTDNPKKGDWKAVQGILYDLQDPHIFIDEDDQAYVFWGSSNVYPIRARKLDKNNRFKPSQEIHELFKLHMDKHGWERFGENHADTVLVGYMEGPWLTKHKDTYYMQYGAPGTEFNVYGDGVYMSKHPLGPYTYAPNNPVSYKPGGFMNGAGHGSTVIGPKQAYWHFATNAISVNVNWERRISMFPTYFDADGLMHVDTYFGDYPRFAPATPGARGEFAGWMLLSYKKPVRTSSSVSTYVGSNAVDEQVKSFWLASTNTDKEWMEIDLQEKSTIHAIQINHHDYQSDLYGKIEGIYHRYRFMYSLDGKQWELLVDKSKSFRDAPNDYIELDFPVSARYIRFENLHVPTPHLAISGLRIFGKGAGKAPEQVKNLVVNRKLDRRDASISWSAVPGAQGYNVIWGIASDKMYSSWLVYENTALDLKALNMDQTYYFSVEAFSENGVSKRTVPLKID